MQHYWLVGHQPRGRGLVLLLSLRGVVSHPKPFHNIHSLNVIFPHFVLFLQNHPEKKLFFFLWYKKYTQIGVSFTFFSLSTLLQPQSRRARCLFVHLYFTSLCMENETYRKKVYCGIYINIFCVFFTLVRGVRLQQRGKFRFCDSYSI